MAKKRRDTRRLHYQYKGDRCAHCRKSVQKELEEYGSIKRVFELHHVDPSQKHPDYDNLIRRVISTEQIDEIDKCVLLCRVCHGRAGEIGRPVTVELTIRARYKQREYTQTERINGFIITRYVIPVRHRFMSNETLKAIPYTIQYGNKTPRFIWGTDVESTLQRECIRNLGKLKIVTVRTLGGEMMVQLTHVSGADFKLKRDVAFPFLHSELCGDDGKVAVWVRNGFALTKDGEVWRDCYVTMTGFRWAEPIA